MFVLKKIFCIFILLFLIIPLSFSEVITFPILGFKTVSSTPVPIDMEWNEYWFGENKSSVYHHGIARIACLLSEISYVDVDKNPFDNVLYSAYHLMGVEDNKIWFDYKLDYHDSFGNNQAGVSFASKKIKSSLGDRTLVYLTVRGTPLNANEWLSNLNISDSTKAETLFHEGFFVTARKIYSELLKYLHQENIEAKDSFFLITGHSRGAAVANLIGKMLSNSGEFNTDLVYVYTFATPNVTTANDIKDEKYNFIINIENAEDLVSAVPPKREKWNFGKYGQIKVLPNLWNTDNYTYEKIYLEDMNFYFKQFLHREYCPLKQGPFLSIQVSRSFTKFNKTVEAYYKGKTSFRNMGEKIFLSVFPNSENTESKDKENNLLNRVGESLDEITDGFVDYLLNAFSDMHVCESYFSWMLALEEEDIFHYSKSVQFILRGNANCTVYDENGNEILHVYDGYVDYKSIKEPVAAITFFENTIIGLPCDRVFTVELGTESIFYTPVFFKNEEYDASGLLLSKSDYKTLFLNKGKVYRFKISPEKSIIYDKNGYILMEHEKGSVASNITDFFIAPEIGINEDKNVYGGFHTGIPAIYASILYSRDNFFLGLGSSQNLIYRFYLDEEFFYKIDEKNIQNNKYLFRMSFSYKPVRKLKIFASYEFVEHEYMFGIRF